MCDLRVISFSFPTSPEKMLKKKQIILKSVSGKYVKEK